MKTGDRDSLPTWSDYRVGKRPGSGGEIDVSLIDSQLRRSVAQRIAVHDRALNLALALRQAVGDRHV